MRKVENAVQESHDYVGCQEQTSKHKDYQKSEEMSTKNIIMMSCSRILKQQRCCLRKHLGKLLKNNESFKKALRWAIEMMKMSKLRILNNNKRGHLRKHSDRLSKQWVIQRSTQMGYWNDKNVKTENIK